MGCPLVDEFLLRVTTAHHRSSIRPARPCSATWSEPGSLTARPTSEPAPLCPFPPRHHGCRRQADRRTGRGDMASGRRPPARMPTAGLPGGDGHLRPHSELWDDGARRALNYTEFFDRRDDLLTDDGLMLHHTIGSNESTQSIDAWLDRYVFPGGVVPSLHQMAGAAQHRWTIEDVQNLGPDYDRTLMSWHSNIEARWGEVPGYDERFRRTWRYYLLSSAASFRIRNLQLFQIAFTRTRCVSPLHNGIC
jgi:hypothetical protein